MLRLQSQSLLSKIPSIRPNLQSGKAFQHSFPSLRTSTFNSVLSQQNLLSHSQSKNFFTFDKSNLKFQNVKARLTKGFSNTFSQQRRQYSQDDWQNEYKDLPRLIYGWTGTIIKPLIFTVVVAGGALYLANSEEVKEWKRKRAIKRHLDRMRGQQGNSVSKWWNSYSDSMKTMICLIGANTAVFLLWQVPAFTPFMATYFMHTSLSNKVSPLLLSCFSHKSFGHFAFNMIALHSFGSSVNASMGREQMLGIYVAGGVTSSLASHFFKVATKDLVPSLGASGAVFALVAAATFLDPDARLAIIFLPFFDFSAGSMLPALMLFDFVGCILSATRIYRIGLDHAAHLGGAIFGWVYTQQLVEYFKNKMRRR